MFGITWQSCSLLIFILTCTTYKCEEVNELYTSIIGLESLLHTELVLSSELREYLKSTKLHVATLESELSKIELEHVTASANTENYLTNPVNAYRLIKRLHTDWRLYEERIRQYDSSKAHIEFLAHMSQHRTTLNFPSKDDVDGSALALVRLLETYELNVTQVAGGFINGIKYGTGMNWQDCFTLGQQMYAIEEYNQTKIWLKESINRLNEEKYYKEATSLDFMEGVAEKLFYLGDLKEAWALSDQVLQLDAARLKVRYIKSAIESIPEQLNDTLLKVTADTDSYHSTQEYKVYKEICRGEFAMPAARLRPLRCRYITNNLAYRLLAPFKVEEHSLEPLVLTFHDIISDTQISTIKHMAAPHMQRSTVRTEAAYLSTTSLYRTSKHAWLQYHTHMYMQRMLRDLHDATGLDMTYCEELQVANYVLGGHYEPHWDFYTTETQVPDHYGNRIATAIFYLSDVEHGGATAFPYLQIAITPKKGNVLFWYNLHRSLDKDYRTKHAGCPVLKGSKWIANVWIRELTQTFARPCAAHRDNDDSSDYEIIQ